MIHKEFSEFSPTSSLGDAVMYEDLPLAVLYHWLAVLDFDFKFRSILYRQRNIKDTWFKWSDSWYNRNLRVNGKHIATRCLPLCARLVKATMYTFGILFARLTAPKAFVSIIRDLISHNDTVRNISCSSYQYHSLMSCCAWLGFRWWQMFIGCTNIHVPDSSMLSPGPAIWYADCRNPT